MAKANISNAKTQRHRVFFYEHEMHERNGTSVPSVSSVFMFILTTDIQDFSDINHERKRDNPSNLCYLCSKNKTTDIWDLTDVNHERKREYLSVLCSDIKKTKTS